MLKQKYQTLQDPMRTLLSLNMQRWVFLEILANQMFDIVMHTVTLLPMKGMRALQRQTKKERERESGVEIAITCERLPN
jgi:hypothetical protein